MALKYASKDCYGYEVIKFEAGKQYVLSESKKPKYSEITGEILSDSDDNCFNELLMNFKKPIEYNVPKQIQEERREFNHQKDQDIDSSQNVDTKQDTNKSYLGKRWADVSNSTEKENTSVKRTILSYFAASKLSYGAAEQNSSSVGNINSSQVVDDRKDVSNFKESGVNEEATEEKISSLLDLYKETGLIGDDNLDAEKDDSNFDEYSSLENLSVFGNISESE